MQQNFLAHNEQITRTQVPPAQWRNDNIAGTQQQTAGAGDDLPRKFSKDVLEARDRLPVFVSGPEKALKRQRWLSRPVTRSGSAEEGSQQKSLSESGERLRSELQSRYQVERFDSDHVLGEGYRGVDAATNRAVFIRVLTNKSQHHDDFFALKEQILSFSHKTVIVPREVIEQAGVGTVFIFDEPAEGFISLRTLLRGLQQDADEATIGTLFTRLVVTLRELEQVGQLPFFARIDIDSVFIFQDGNVKLMHPAATLHFDGDDGHHHHKKLEKRLKKLEKKEAKDGADGEAIGTEKEELFERFIIADLSILLFELMTRELSHASRHMMVSKAKRNVKKADKASNKRYNNYTFSQWQLLVDVLDAGRSPKKEMVTLEGILQRPFVQGFAKSLEDDKWSEPLMQLHRGSFERRNRARGFIGGQQQWRIGSRRWFSEKESMERRTARARLVKGQGMQLGSLAPQPIEKRRGVRFDIPLDGSIDSKVPQQQQQRAVEQPLSSGKQLQFEAPRERRDIVG